MAIDSPYSGKDIVLTSKHDKDKAIEPAFSSVLGARLITNLLDTDQLGTFTGEIERAGDVLSCVKRKCEWGMDKADSQFGIASEGSFGPHPQMPFLPGDVEVLYFIDRERDLQLHLSQTSTNTNYQMQTIDSLASLNEFAEKAQFPSHALIIRPNAPRDNQHIVKGLQNQDDLEHAFHHACSLSDDSSAWIETDMRAHVNPSRMKIISELAVTMAKRLSTTCPSCNAPGWGQISIETGLECELCGAKTNEIKFEIYGCVKCGYKESKPPKHGMKKADPGRCQFCNP